MRWYYIALGKPQRTGFNESFNGELREEVLNGRCSAPCRRPGSPRSLGARLQQNPTSLEAGMADAGGLRVDVHRTTAGLLRWLMAALTGLLPFPPTSVQITKGLSLRLDKKRGVTSE